MQIAMSRGGRAWRGYFPVGSELTSGKPDRKEGIYFGSELPADHPAVLAGKPLHGPNLFPEIPGFRETVLRYLDSLTQLGHTLMSGISLGLGLDEDYFQQRYTGDPLILFRIFNYPYSNATESGEMPWGVGEHTDYGLLTILRQDDTGGLQVKSRSGWIDAPPIPGSFVCNIGDMLDRLTRGIYRSTPHRVVNTSQRDRLSFPFFFDPNFDAQILPIEGLENRAIADDSHERWDHASVHEFSGTYGDYLLNKVSKVFPSYATKFCNADPGSQSRKGRDRLGCSSLGKPKRSWTGSTPNHSAMLTGGGGEMGALMRAFDWSRTPLGPVETWPQSLRSA